MNRVLQVKNVISEYVFRQRAVKHFRLPAERVLAEQLGYSRATVGKALSILEGEGVIVRKKGSGTFITENGIERTKTIALILRTAYHYTDAYFQQVIEIVSKHAEDHNTHIQIFDKLPEMFKKNPEDNPLLTAINNKVIDGVLVASRMPLSIVSQISAICPTVSVNNIFGGDEIPCVTCDYFHVGFLAGQYLIEKGHRKIAYITDTISHTETTFEFEGFKLALKMGGVSITKADILNTKRNTDIVNKRVFNFFKDSSYTACFERHSFYALKVISVLQNNGIKVPEDISMICGGNYKNGTQSDLKLTIVDNQLEKMFKSGLDILHDIIKKKNKHKGVIKLVIPKIIENNSVININKIKLSK